MAETAMQHMGKMPMPRFSEVPISDRQPEVYIFAGGGTGGHLYPGLAVAEELVALRPGAGIVFACSDRPIDRRILDGEPYGVVPQPVRPLPRGIAEAPGFVWSWVRSARLARDLVGDLRPRAVLGLGGFAAAPVVFRAARKGVPTALLNPDAVPGKANQWLARRVRVVFTQFASTERSFPEALRQKVRHVGCPVRRGLVLGLREEAAGFFGLREDRRTLLVLGGSLGAASINEAISALEGELDALAGSWQLLHVTGPDKAPAGAPGPARALHVRRLEYCHRMDLAYAAADLVLCRAGAVTTAELAATGAPAVLLPYPYHADQHQRLNARALAEAGAGVVVEDRKAPAANAAALRELLLPLLGDAKRLEAMRRAAGGLARPEAARCVARWMAEGV